MAPFQIAGFAVCAAALALVMRKLRPEAAPLLVIAAGALAVMMVIPQLAEIIDSMTALAAAGGVQNGYTLQLLKVGGISLLMDFSAQTCRDAGEDGLALKVELAGRIMLIVLALPVIHSLLSQIMFLSS